MNKNEEQFEQLVARERENLTYEAKDEDLVVAINLAIADSKELKEEMDKIGKLNKIYWKAGTTKDLTKVHPKKTEVVDNRIFTDVETSIPILTSETPEPNVLRVENDLREKISRYLEICYEITDKMQQRLQKMVRHWYLNRIGVMKYRWTDDGYITENILPKNIGFDRRADSLANCEFIFEHLEENLGKVIEKFPGAKDKLQVSFGKNEKTKLKYLEFWGGGGEWVAWKVKDILLDKKKNPNFDYDDPENNLFKKPRFPYLLMNVFSLGDETGLYDDTSLIEESIPLQDGVNKMETQILDLNEGQKRVWAVSGEAMSKQQFQELVNKTGDLGVYYDRKTPKGGIQLPMAGKPDNSLFNPLTHLLNEIDNIMGMHSTTRGSREEQETLGGRQLLMGSDYGRLDLIVRNIEQVMEEWYNAKLHMLKVYAEGPETVSDGEEDIELDPAEIPSKAQVMVKKGSTLPVDKRSRMDMALQLAKADKIDPETLYDELGYGDSEERTKKLYEWLTATGKANPEVLGAFKGAQGEQSGQLNRLTQILNSPEFQNLPDEEKRQFVAQARAVVEKIKGGAQPNA